MNDLGISSLAVFGGSGKLGQALIPRFLDRGMSVTALIHSTPVGIEHERLTQVRGDVRRPDDVARTLEGAGGVLCLATTKEDPETFFDVSVRGTFNIVEACREQESVRQVILAGGDAACGIWFYPHSEPINEKHALMAYPGYYAFSKVLEEVIVQQYGIQYHVPWTILRMSWIFQEGDILNHLSLRNLNPAEKGHGWDEYLTDEHRAILERGEKRIPILVNQDGVPYTRHIVHMDDVVHAFEVALGAEIALDEVFHIAAPAAFRYDEAARYLSDKTGIPTCEIVVSGYYPFEIDISKARNVLGYDPQKDVFGIIDDALAWQAGEG